MSSFVVDFITVLFIFILAFASPINNGFKVKFNAVNAKNEAKIKSFAALFSKIPQELKAKTNCGIISQAIFPQDVDPGTGCMNQYAKILFPSRAIGFNESKSLVKPNFINIPMIEEDLKDYKIIVAKAPKKFRLGRGTEAMPVIVYIVFPDDDPEEISIKMPDIYFVRKVDGLSLDKNDKVDPVLIIDSNRTVTGLKSTEVLKFVKFKNKLTNRFYY